VASKVERSVQIHRKDPLGEANRKTQGSSAHKATVCGGGEAMPFYKIAEMQQNPSTANPQQFVQSAAGEFMKAGIVTKPEDEGPPLHMHPNEEQFTLVLDGKLHFVLGDEERICERGDLIHIPRFTNHRSRAIGGPAVFFTVKSPAGDGDLDQDYHRAEGAEEAETRFAQAKKKI
jgi:quercetin dioxygenase-like cupin family protein